MTTTTITALYDHRVDAEHAAELLAAETMLPRSDISIIAQDGETTTATRVEETGFWASLGNLFIPDDDRYAYSEAVRRGGFLLTAMVDQTKSAHALDILDRSGAVNFEEREATWRQEGWTSAPLTADTTSTAHDGDETIRLAEERLTVGKRQVDAGRIRVRSYVVETPVQEQVSLHEERVTIERRPVDRPATAADAVLFGDKVIEATATREEAVVAKTAHVTEELVVKKTAEERVETIHDSVRRTEVEVEDSSSTGTTTTQPGFVPPRR